MNNLPSVTIGIPVYNEEKNIGYLVRSILRQKQECFTLKRIIIISDGSTDGTSKVVRKLARDYKVIKFIKDRSRHGKVHRLNQLYAANRSDFLLTIDADYILERNIEIEELLKTFGKSQKVCLVAGNPEPIESDSFAGKIFCTANQLWKETRMPVNGGDHIANVFGSVCMLRGWFAKSVRYPAGITADEDYLYIMAKKVGKFRYAKNTRFLYRIVSNVHDWRLQGTRALSERFFLAQYLGHEAIEEHCVPFGYKLRATTKMFSKSPFFTTLAIALNIYLRLFPLEDKLNRTGMWEQVASTKEAIGE